MDPSILAASEEYFASKYPIGSSTAIMTTSHVNGCTGMENLQTPTPSGVDTMTANASGYYGQQMQSDNTGWVLADVDPSEPTLHNDAENTLLQEILHMNKRCMNIINSVRNKNFGTVRGQWTSEEDEKLMRSVGQIGLRKWPSVARALKGRSGKQCRERWYNHLQPNIKKDGWSEEEDKILIKGHKMMGNRWSEIVKCLPGRTENSVKNHWNTTKRRQLSRRTYRSTKNTYNSPLLLNYIRSLNPTDEQNLNSSFDTEVAKDPPSLEEAQPTADSDFDFSSFPDFPDVDIGVNFPVYNLDEVTQFLSCGNDFLNDELLMEEHEWDLFGNHNDLCNFDGGSVACENYGDIAAATSSATDAGLEMNDPMSPPMTYNNIMEEDFDLMEMTSAQTNLN